MLYAYTSGAGNNGSAFAGLNANTPWWNVTLGITMLAGRFLMMIPILGIAGSMIGKKTVPPGPGTFPTNGGLFVGLLVGVILIVGALTFFPALSLGPIVEHFLALHGKLFWHGRLQAPALRPADRPARPVRGGVQARPAPHAAESGAVRGARRQRAHHPRARVGRGDRPRRSGLHAPARALSLVHGALRQLR